MALCPSCVVCLFTLMKLHFLFKMVSKGIPCVLCHVTKRERPELVFHTFPKNKKRALEWVNALRHEPLREKNLDKIIRGSRICSQHFSEANYIQDKTNSRLRWDACPDTFLGNGNMDVLPPSIIDEDQSEFASYSENIDAMPQYESTTLHFTYEQQFGSLSTSPQHGSEVAPDFKYTSPRMILHNIHGEGSSNKKQEDTVSQCNITNDRGRVSDFRSASSDSFNQEHEDIIAEDRNDDAGTASAFRSVFSDCCNQEHKHTIPELNITDDRSASSMQAAKKRWNALRDCYRKALNRKKTVSSQKAVHIAPWKYEEQMSFLKAHVSQKRPQRRNMDDTATYDENPGAETDGDGASGDITSHETQEEEDNAQLLSFDNSTVPKPRKETEGAPIKKKQCTPKPSAPKPSAHDIISTYFENKKSARDHLTSYFKMVEDTVRTFTPLQQVEIKSRFSSILTEYEYKNLRSAEERSHLRSTSTTFPDDDRPSENEEAAKRKQHLSQKETEPKKEPLPPSKKRKVFRGTEQENVFVVDGIDTSTQDRACETEILSRVEVGDIDPPRETVSVKQESVDAEEGEDGLFENKDLSLSKVLQVKEEVTIKEEHIEGFDYTDCV